jgi:hypothetical protein
VQRIARKIPVLKMGVRFPPRALPKIKSSFVCDYFHRQRDSFLFFFAATNTTREK